MVNGSDVPIFVLIGWLLIGLAGRGLFGQTELVGRNFFPADLEFKELKAVRSEQTFEAGAALAGVDDRDLFRDAEFQKYSRRVYDLAEGTLSIEVVSFRDSKAAYSVLTLLDGSAIQAGPPGDWLSSNDGRVAFAQGSFYVRLLGSPATDLARRVATSVSNRIGRREPASIGIVARFPEKGLDRSSIRYFVSPEAFREYGRPVAGKPLPFKPELEVAQAAYTLADRQGLLTVISFPTTELSEDYFDETAALYADSRTSGAGFYSKRAGPILGYVSGSFDAGTAGELLRSIEYKYSVKWIFDKKNRGSRTVWGIPVPILGTVVRSLLFTAFLCGISLIAGIAFATFRVLLRGYAPNNILDRPERTEIIRLRINDEN